MQAMKYLMAFLLLFLSLPAHAQTNAPPEVRPFPEGTTSFEQLRKKKEEERPDAKTPDKRQPNVEIWLPPEFQSTEQKWPLLIFSHGFGGCAKQSAFLTEYLADRGYIVIAPDHADARSKDYMGGGKLHSLRGGMKDWPEKPFRTPEAWTDKTEADRKDDVIFALESMLDDRQYRKYIDTDRMGLIGHSLGGYTMLGIAGGWNTWKDKRFKAVLALSPYTGPYLRNRGLKAITVPVMYQGGTKDDPITPSIMRRGGAYDLTQAPKYFIEYQGANHFSFTGLESGYHDIIRRTALDFLNKYVKGESVEINEDKKPQVKTFWKDEGAAAKKE